MEQLKEKKIIDEQYLHFISLYSLEVSEETIILFITENYYKGQNFPEALNWRIVKNRKISEILVPTYGIMRYKNFTITVQDRGFINLKQDFHERMDIMREKIDVLKDRLKTEGYNTADLHANNIVLMPDGKYKICDTGFCRF
jgi:hypothetical protein